MAVRHRAFRFCTLAVCERCEGGKIIWRWLLALTVCCVRKFIIDLWAPCKLHFMKFHKRFCVGFFLSRSLYAFISHKNASKAIHRRSKMGGKTCRKFLTNTKQRWHNSNGEKMLPHMENPSNDCAHCRYVNVIYTRSLPYDTNPNGRVST